MRSFRGRLLRITTGKIDYYLTHEEERKEKAQTGKEIVLKEHTFDQRVKVIADVIEEMRSYNRD